MCVAICHKMAVLFWNHEDCSFEFCPLVTEEHGRCHRYIHRQGEICMGDLMIGLAVVYVASQIVEGIAGTLGGAA